MEIKNKEKKYTREEWEKEGERLFGPDKKNWRFVCPGCGHVASVQEWRDAKAPDAAAFSCIGRYLDSEPQDFLRAKKGSGPCNYAGGGLFAINPVQVDDSFVFDFAEVKS